MKGIEVERLCEKYNIVLVVGRGRKQVGHGSAPAEHIMRKSLCSFSYLTA